MKRSGHGSSGEREPLTGGVATGVSAPQRLESSAPLNGVHGSQTSDGGDKPRRDGNGRASLKRLRTDSPHELDPNTLHAAQAALPLIKPFSAVMPDQEGDGVAVKATKAQATKAVAAPVVLSFSESQSATSSAEADVGGGGLGEWRSDAERIARGDKTARDVKAPVSQHRYAMVCSSNVNRSVLGQIVLEKMNMAVSSFGVGTDVKLPGRSRGEPAVFPFGTPYIEMHDILWAADKQLYTRNGVLRLLARDACTKRHPERWQDLPSAAVAAFDVVICFENRIFDICVQDLQDRDALDFKPISLISVPVKDTPQDAEEAMEDVTSLCEMLEACEDLESDVSGIVEAFQETTKRAILHQVCHL
eukprot:TRINITY_DN510_c0_g1_i4.p1 TRINITY_DN510_c0_g1~~TRINITY_DN510_c0_g1_i4.p1  ORF type:complete len:361 (+),score=77.54 TRINITY_DN510_c0_g1_i4:178-1260(+)